MILFLAFLHNLLKCVISVLQFWVKKKALDYEDNQNMLSKFYFYDYLLISLYTYKTSLK